MSNWSKRKRLEATMAGEAVDRPPVALWRHWPGDDQDAAALAAAHVQWQRNYDWDLIKVSPASTYPVRDWGVRDEWQGTLEGTRTITRHAVTEPEDWVRLQPLDPGRGMLHTQIQALNLLGEGLKGEVPFIATIFSPLSQAKNLAGNERMLSHMRSHPDAFQQGLKTITETTLRYISAARESGIAGLYFAVQHSRYPQMSRAEFEQFGKFYDLQVLSAVTDLWLNVVHIHSTDIMFDLVADYPAQVINWHDRESGFSLAAGLKQIKAAASGGVSRWSMHQQSPETALAEAEEALAETGGRRLILGTGCVVMVTTPTRNIRALRQLVES